MYTHDIQCDFKKKVLLNGDFAGNLNRMEQKGVDVFYYPGLSTKVVNLKLTRNVLVQANNRRDGKDIWGVS